MTRMLIVDDEPDICECLGEFFASRGFAVMSAFSGEEALDRLANSTAEIILLDILLPGISGMEVLKRAKELCPHAKVVMVTGLTDPKLQLEAKVHGACGYVTKPFDFSESTWAPVLSF